LPKYADFTYDLNAEIRARDKTYFTHTSQERMMRHRILFVVGWLLLCLTVPTLAQLSEDGETFTFENALTLSIPDGWTVADQDNEEKDFVALDDSRTGVSLLLYYPATLAESNAETPADVITAHYNSILNLEIDEGDIEDVTLEGFDGARYSGNVATDTDEYEQVAYAFMLPDGYGLLGLIYPMRGSGLRSTSEDDAVPIIESVMQQVDSSGTDITPDVTLPDIGSGNGDDNNTSTEDLTSHNFGYMTVLDIHEGWTLEEGTDSLAILDDGTTKIEIAYYTPHRAGLKGRDAEDLMLEYFKTVNNAEANPLDPDDLDSTTIAELDAVRYETIYSPDADVEYELVAYSLLLPNESGIVASIYPSNGKRLESEVQSLSVIEEFVAAQPVALETIDLGYAVMFDVPRGWAVYDKQDDRVEIDNGATTLRIYSYYPSTVEEERFGSAEDVLAYHMDNWYPDVSFRARDAEGVDVGRVEGARFNYEADEDGRVFPRTLVAVLLDDEQRAVVADIFPLQADRMVGEEETLLVFEDAVAEVDDMPEDFEFVDGSTFEFPRGWNYYSSTADYFLNMDDNVTGMLLDMYTPEEIDGNAETPEELLEWYRDESIPGSQAEDVEVGGLEGIRFEATSVNSEGTTYPRIQYAFMLPNDHGLIVAIYPLYGEEFNERDALPLLESFLEANR